MLAWVHHLYAIYYAVYYVVLVLWCQFILHSVATPAVVAACLDHVTTSKTQGQGAIEYASYMWSLAAIFALDRIPNSQSSMSFNHPPILHFGDINKVGTCGEVLSTQTYVVEY